MQLLNGTSGFAFVDHKTPVFTYNNGINGVDFVGGYPVLVCNGKQYFTKDPAGLGGYRGRTALGLNEKNFSFIFVPEQAGSADAELTDVASTFISMGYNTSTSFQNFKPGKWFYIQISPGNNAYVCAQYLVKQG